MCDNSVKCNLEIAKKRIKVRKMGIERGKEQAMESPGTGAQRGHREKAWGKILKGQKGKKDKRSKGQKVKSHI